MKTTDELLFDLMQELDARKSVPSKKTDKKLLILSTPRSGSTLFCDVLNNTNKIGECREWFNMRYITAFAKMRKKNNVDLTEYIKFITEKTISNTGIFAVNMHIEQYTTMLKNKIDIKSLGFDLVIYLYRKDKLSQAVSLSIAQLTDQWSDSTKALQDIKGKVSNHIITNALNHIANSEFVYNDNFKKTTKKEYCYEDFSDLKNTNCFREVFEDLNISLPKLSPTSNTQKQRNEVSKKIKNKFLYYLLGEY